MAQWRDYDFKPARTVDDLLTIIWGYRAPVGNARAGRSLV